MNHYISPRKTACTFAILIGGMHLGWSALVALGWAQALMDFIFWAHMISLSFVVESFDLTAAATLVVMTSFMGWVVGYLVALVWNRMHRE